jgi:hypothetical protein
MQLHVGVHKRTTPMKNNKIMVREICGAKINPKSFFKN